MIVDRVIDLAGGILGKIPSGDARVAAERELRAIVSSQMSEWGPTGIAGVTTAVALNAYLLLSALPEVTGTFVAFKIEIVGVWLLLLGALFNFKLLDWVKFMSEWRKDVRDR